MNLNEYFPACPKIIVASALNVNAERVLIMFFVLSFLSVFVYVSSLMTTPINRKLGLR